MCCVFYLGSFAMPGSQFQVSADASRECSVLILLSASVNAAYLIQTVLLLHYVCLLLPDGTLLWHSR